MPQLEIQPIAAADLPAVAAYVHRAVNRAPGLAQDLPVSAGLGADDYLAIFRWRTLDNPARPVDMELGQCIRRSDGSLAGVHLVCPFRYRWQDRQLLGACSGVYFADDDARIQAFFLFRRFLALPGFDFYFANTCNAYSSRVWEKCGGRPVPDSDQQRVYPLRIGPLVREMLIRRGWKRIAAPAQWAGSIFDVLSRRTSPGGLQIQPTTDRQFMAEIAARGRNPNHLVPDRDQSYFEWQYDRRPTFQRNHVFRFQDAAQREGWFATSAGRLGVDRNLEVVTITDWALPAPPFDFSSVIRAAASHFAATSDAVVFRPRIDMQISSKVPRLRHRDYPAPQCWMIPSSRDHSNWPEILITSQADAV